jgi:hypothetical protein
VIVVKRGRGLVREPVIVVRRDRGLGLDSRIVVNLARGLGRSQRIVAEPLRGLDRDPVMVIDGARCLGFGRAIVARGARGLALGRGMIIELVIRPFESFRVVAVIVVRRDGSGQLVDDPDRGLARRFRRSPPPSHAPVADFTRCAPLAHELEKVFETHRDRRPEPICAADRDRPHAEGRIVDRLS